MSVAWRSTTARRRIVGVIAMLALVPWLGLYGAALGSLIGTAAVSLPLNLSALARQEGVRVAASSGHCGRGLSASPRRSPADAGRDRIVARARGLAWGGRRFAVALSTSYLSLSPLPEAAARNDARPEDATRARIPAPLASAPRASRRRDGHRAATEPWKWRQAACRRRQSRHQQRVGADVVHDLNSMPWPFGNDTFDEVHAYDVIEHLHDVVRIARGDPPHRTRWRHRAHGSAAFFMRQRVHGRDPSPCLRLAQPRSSPRFGYAASSGAL